MINFAYYIPRFKRIFYTSFTLILAILLGCLGKLPESNNNTALAQKNIPVSGIGDARLQPLKQSLTEFMRHRCVGAAVLGVSVKGKPVGVWGFGRMKGRPTNNWNPACGEGYAGSSGSPSRCRYPHAYGQYQQAC
ncbi:hypothetical protein [Microcoleus sp.]|uniref:hypothetical protein n=1 Tax=Microcoleus sp. TaxID=44472 RepID=UPI00403ED99E